MGRPPSCNCNCDAGTGTGTEEEAGTGTVDTPGTCVGTCICTAMPRYWRLTVSGVTDGSCTQCNERYNGTFILTFRSCANQGDLDDNVTPCRCTWIYQTFSAGSNPCNASATGQYALFCDRFISTDRLMLLMDFPEINYQVPSFGWYRINSPFNCQASNTLSRGGTKPGCTIPLTVTIEPL